MRAGAVPRPLRFALAWTAGFNLASALVGMAGLTFGGGMGIPLEWIAGTVFTSYVWPGVILGCFVGGTQALACVGQWRRFHLAWGLHATAGLTMMIWIFIEIAIMLVWSPLHGIYFATGLVQTVLAILALGAWPRPFFAREPGRSARTQARTSQDSRGEIAVRAAAADDAARLGGLLSDFNAEFETPTPSAAELASQFRSILAESSVIALLAEGRDSGQPVGFALLTLRPTPYFDGPLAQLEELYVVPALRDRGIGTALLVAAVEGVRARGSREMHIGVDEIDTDTRRFYERNGFVNREPGQDSRMLLYLRELD